MIISYANGWAKTIDLNGRTNRKEFWAFAIIDLITIPIAFYLIIKTKNFCQIQVLHSNFLKTGIYQKMKKNKDQL